MPDKGGATTCSAFFSVHVIARRKKVVVFPSIRGIIKEITIF
jgi:hypothetical protein